MVIDVEAIRFEVQERIDTLGGIEVNAEDRISTIEDIKDRAVQIKASLEEDIELLDRIVESINEAEVIEADADYENIVA